MSKVVSDIFADWKRNRFMIVSANNPSVAMDWPNQCEYVAILADVGYWVENLDPLNSWCEDQGFKIRGMVVMLPDEAAAVLFTLRWS
jgi:hypothetical protein